MKILLLSPLPPPSGGIASYTNRLLGSALSEFCTFHLVNTAVTGKRVEKPDQRHFWEEIRRAARICRQTKESLQRESFDLLHLNSSLSRGGIFRDFIILRLAKSRKVPIILHCHCDVRDAARGRLQKALVKKLCLGADSVLCLSKASKDYLHAFCPAVILPNFLPAPVMRTYHMPKQYGPLRTAVFVGDLSKEKGADVILRAADRLPHIRFLLIGRMMENMESAYFPKNIRLTGLLSAQAVADILAQADVFVFPSLSEGFPYAVLEAMAAGLPVIATRTGALPEMLGASGIFIKQGDDRELARALKRISSPSVRQKLGQANRKRAQTHYTDTAVLPQLWEIWKRTAGNSSV